MAYDFNGAKSITIGSRDVSKITNKATGEVIWEKLYYWEVYEAVEKDRKLKTATSLSTYTAPTSGYLYAEAKLSDDGQDIVLSDTSIDNTSSGYWNTRYTTLGWHGGFRNGDPDDVAYFKASEGYFKYNYNECFAVKNSSGKAIGGKGYLLSINVTYTKGAYIKTVSSNSSSAFPTSGERDGFYYVKIT